MPDRDILLELLDDTICTMDGAIKGAQMGNLTLLAERCKGSKNFCILLRSYIQSGDTDLFKFFNSVEVQRKYGGK